MEKNDKSITYKWSEIVLCDLFEIKRGWKSTEPWHKQEKLWKEVHDLRNLIYEEMKKEKEKISIDTMPGK